MALTQVDQGLLGTYAQYTGFKNRIINGAMVIDQRNAGASVSIPATTNTYFLDRWYSYSTQASKYSIQQNAGSVTTPAGFTKYLGVTVGASAYSIVSSDIMYLAQKIEGFNTQDLAWGTATAATVTLSFRVYSSLTGTFGGVILNASFNYSYPFTYSIPVANTWTTISITIAGPTSGSWSNITNDIGMLVGFQLGVGSNYTGAAGSWSASSNYGATGATSVVGTANATFYITGVQLEKGSTATSFDYRPYGTELALCERYCLKFGGGSTNDAFGSGFSAGTSFYVFVPFPVTMRATPSLSLYGSASDLNITAPGVAAAANGTPAVVGTGIASSVLQLGSATSITTGYAVYARVTSSATWITLTAEL